MSSPVEESADRKEKKRVQQAIRPVMKRSLSDRLAKRIRTAIQSGDYKEGDRLPAIMEMARRFGVGHPTVREALKKLETIGVVEIRHGAGVFVSRSHEVLLMASPDYTGTVTRKLLLDLLETRISLEVESIACAVRHATEEQIAGMRESLAKAAACMNNDAELKVANMTFHRHIALASNNAILAQLVDVLQDLFTDEQQGILNIIGSREQDHREHLELLQAIEARDEQLCASLMRSHLEGVRQAIILWNPVEHPLPGIVA